MAVRGPIPLDFDELPFQVRQTIPPDASLNIKMMAARSMLPLMSNDLVSALYYLAFDKDVRVRRAARRSLREFPEDFIIRLLGSSEIHPKILDYFARRTGSAFQILELILLNRTTWDETFVHIARTAENEQLLEICANNQERLLRYPFLLAALYDNPYTPKSVIERAISFFELSTGKKSKDILQEARDYWKAEEEEPKEAVSDIESEVQPPTSTPESALISGPQEEEPVPSEQPPIAEEHPSASDQEIEEIQEEQPPDQKRPDIFLDEKDLQSEQQTDSEPILQSELEADSEYSKISLTDLLHELQQEPEVGFADYLLEDPDHELTGDERVTLSHAIRNMKVVDKMRLALKGNIEARQILIKSPNKLIQECVLRNPKITIEEIIRLSNDKSMREELIRIIATSREWVKSYPVKLALMFNPKTPLTLAIKFLPSLNDRDLASLGKSKMIAGILANTAKKMAVDRIKRK